MTRRERLEAKLEKREQWAAGRRAKAEGLLASTRKYDGDYAFNTQPGHIPERARVIARQDRAFENLKVADHHAEKAGGLAAQLARTTFSDDPDALDQLRARIAEQEAACERKAAWNTAWKRGAAAGEKKAKAAGKTGAEDLLIARLDGGEQALREAGVSETIILAANTSMEPGYSWVKAPFDMTHLRAEIRRLKGRVEEVTRQRDRAERADAAGGVLIAQNGGGWCSITFSEKPDREVLDALKAAGFRWGSGSWAGKAEALPTCVIALATA